MKDFIFRNDTKLWFRNDIRATIAAIAQRHKVMFVYGGGSVKRNGCYDDIVRILNEAGIPLVEYGGASREFAKIEEGIGVARANGVSMIIGAGGASVMDSAKLADMYYDGRISRGQVDSIPCQTELDSDEIFEMMNALIRR